MPILYTGGTVANRSTGTVIAQVVRSKRIPDATQRFASYVEPSVSLSEIAGEASFTFTPTGAQSAAGRLFGTSFNLWIPVVAQSKAVASLVGTSAVAFSSTGTLSVPVAIAGASSLTFTPSGSASGRAALVSSAQMSVSATAAMSASADLSGSTGASFAPSGSLRGTGALITSTALTFTPSGVVAGVVGLAGSSALTFTPSAAASGTAGLIGSSSIAFSPSGSFGGELSQITGVATFTISGTATLTAIVIPTAARVIFARFDRQRKRNVGPDGNIAWDDYKIRSR